MSGNKFLLFAIALTLIGLIKLDQLILADIYINEKDHKNSAYNTFFKNFINLPKFIQKYLISSIEQEINLGQQQQFLEDLFQISTIIINQKKIQKYSFFRYFYQFYEFINEGIYMLYKEKNKNKYNLNFKNQNWNLLFLPKDKNYLPQKQILNEDLKNFIALIKQINYDTLKNEIQTLTPNIQEAKIDFIKLITIKLKSIFQGHIHLMFIMRLLNCQIEPSKSVQIQSLLIQNLNILLDEIQKQLYSLCPNEQLQITQLINDLKSLFIDLAKQFQINIIKQESFSELIKKKKFKHKLIDYKKFVFDINQKNQKLTQTQKDNLFLFQKIFQKTKRKLALFSPQLLLIQTLLQSSEELTQYLYSYCQEEYKIIKYFQFYDKNKSILNLSKFNEYIIMLQKDIEDDKKKGENKKNLQSYDYFQIFRILSVIAKKCKQEDYKEILQQTKNILNLFIEKRKDELQKNNITCLSKQTINQESNRKQQSEIFYQILNFIEEDILYHQNLFVNKQQIVSLIHIIGFFSPFIYSNYDIFMFPFYYYNQNNINQFDYNQLMLYCYGLITKFQSKNKQKLGNYLALFLQRIHKEILLIQKYDLIPLSEQVVQFLFIYPQILNVCQRYKIQLKPSKIIFKLLLNKELKHICGNLKERLKEQNLNPVFEGLLFMTKQIKQQTGQFNDIELTEKQDEINIDNMCIIIQKSEINIALLLNQCSQEKIQSNLIEIKTELIKNI